MSAVHLERLAPACAPGALYVRIATASGVLLDAHPLDQLEGASGLADEDKALAYGWMDGHPGDLVYVRIYDGDDGVCVVTIVVG